MKKFVLYSIIIVTILFSGCKSNTYMSKAYKHTAVKPTGNEVLYSKYKKDCVGNGNSIGNTANYGTACEDKNYIYYSVTYGNTGIYRMNYDGSNKTKLTSDKAYYLNSDDSFIYYRNVSDNGKLYKIKKVILRNQNSAMIKYFI